MVSFFFFCVPPLLLLVGLRGAFYYGRYGDEEGLRREK